MRHTFLAPHTRGNPPHALCRAPIESDPIAELPIDTSASYDVNYARWSWPIVIGVFLLFFITDTIEHAVLPSLHLGRLSWFLTTALATILVFPISRTVLRDLERVHRRLVDQNRALVAQSEKLAQQSERLSLAVQEAHHRIKNNLQTVASLLSWHHLDGEPSSEAKVILGDSINRIRAIATVHDFLTRDSELTEVNAADVIQQLSANVVSTMASGERIRVELCLDDVYLSSQNCTSLALIANELFLNAIEHAYAPHEEGAIDVSLKIEDDFVVFTVRDNGVGLMAGFDLQRNRGTGLDVALSLVEGDLNGSLCLSSTNGTTARVTFRHCANE